jgi:acyl carrier protein
MGTATGVACGRLRGFATLFQGRPSMDREALKKSLLSILRQSVSSQVTTVDENMRIKEDLNLDSLDFVTVAIEIQSEFNVELDTDEFPDVVVVGDLLDLIQSKLQARKKLAA